MGTRALLPAIMFLTMPALGIAAEKSPQHPATDTIGSWRLGCQAYTFKKFTFFEAVDKTASLGLEWIEAYPGQKLSADMPGARFGHDMPKRARKLVQEKLDRAGVRLAAYGVVRFPDDPAGCKKIFEFAREMGIDTITAEPKAEQMDIVEKYCQKYGIKAAIHNHPKDSHYWHPKTVLETCSGRSRLIGCCADTGHWMRSGIRPVEGLKMLEGRVLSLHLKDLNDFGRKDAHDVVWGTGHADMHAVLAELHRQGFAGLVSIEYEHNWLESLPEIRRCVEYFDNVALEFEPEGWHNLLSRDLANCTLKPGSWTFKNGVLARNGGGDLWTKQAYGDFTLDLEFMVDKKTNSGVFFRTGDIKDNVQTGIEMQVYDSHGKKQVGKHDCGAIYDCLAPSRNMARPPGEWNRCTITCVESKVSVALNGEQVIDMDLNHWTEPGKNPDGSKNKYRDPFKDRPRTGHIGFQDHGKPVWYRNLRIKSCARQ